ncbi:uncharacterized protein EDB91DRAFT_1013669, partial [Suillus paluster]|uniref:uncharacterized protein n=1 Tax=Suillus paluster TaxID=48578 RepID=UPI001B861E29
VLKLSEVASYTWVGEFKLLKHSCSEILHKPWAVKHFRIVWAHEEIHRLSIEISHLQEWVDTEDAHIL